MLASGVDRGQRLTIVAASSKARSNALNKVILAVLVLVGLHGSLALGAELRLANGEHDINLKEVRLHYVVRGQGPALFVTSPGWGVGSNYLQSSLTPLEQKFTVVYIDTRGSGGSSRPADRSRMSQGVMADDIDELRERLGLPHIDLLGHSDGGTIAIEYGLRHRQHARKLVLIAPGVLGDFEPETTSAYMKLWASDPQYANAVREVKESDWDSPGFTDETFARSLAAMLPLYFADPSRYVPIFMKAHLKGRPSAYAYQAQSEAAKKAGRNQAADAGLIEASTLILNGTVDWICPYTMAQRLHTSIPDSQLRLYANKGHFPWIEDGPRFFREVTKFLQQ
jgi:proline iminopeptidase